MSAAPALDREITVPDGWRVLRFATIGSTNEEARDRAPHAAHGTVIVTERQSAGRGRRGRPWVSPAGNLHASVILKPACAGAAAGQLSFVVAVAMAEALTRLAPDLPVRLKWPNDLLIGDAKLAGILLESALAPDGGVDWVVAGVGVNIAHHPDDVERPAVSLAAAGRDLTVDALLTAYLAALDTWLTRWRDEGFGPIRAAWLDRAAGVGQPILVRLDTETRAGRFDGIDRNGALILGLADGSRQHIVAGDVFFGGA
ncbi:MAG: biotin--[acetyl-CoA-carboxylase] ligase [Inquilinaceae bacterium]